MISIYLHSFKSSKVGFLEGTYENFPRKTEEYGDLLHENELNDPQPLRPLYVSMEHH